MNSYISRFASTPYLSPPPPNPNIKTTDLHPEDTLLTLFEGFEHTLVNDRTEKLRMFKDLENNLPTICNLQSDRLPNGAEPSKNSSTVMPFLMQLTDKLCHLFSLCPIPKLDTLKLDFLLNHCLYRRIPVERAVWAIHHYVIKKETQAETLTNTLISIQPPDIVFYCKLCYGLYRENLLVHTTFLKWAIVHIQPEYLMDYEKDLIRTHSLLYYALSSTNSKGASNFPIFLDYLCKSLLINQSHIIQLSLLCENQKIFNLSQAECIYKLISNNNLLKRTRHIHELLFSTEIRRDCSSSLSFLLPIIIFKDFPRYNFEVILNNIRSASFFLKQSAQSEIALNICQTVINRFNDPMNVSSLIAWLIRKLGFKLEINSFCEWIYEFVETTFSITGKKNDNSIFNSLKVLFYELQYQGVLNYKEFYLYIRGRGYFSTRYRATKRIISEFPILLYDLIDRDGKKKKKSRRVNYLHCANKCFPKVLLNLHHFYPDNQIESKMKNITSNVTDHVEMIKSLPFAIQFIIAVWMIVSNDTNQKRLDSKSMYNFLNEIEASFLIPELTRNSDFIPRNAKRYLAAYESHGLRNGIEKVITEKISPSTPVDRSKVSNFFMRFPHLCSLHLFDLSFSIRTRGEFCSILSLFFNDLLSFKNISYKYFTDFFNDFCFTMIVPDSVELFISLFLSVCFLEKHFYKNKESVSPNSILNDIDNDQNNQKFSNVLTFSSHFVNDLFRNRIIKPSLLAMIVLNIVKDQQKDESAENRSQDSIDKIIFLVQSTFQSLFDFLNANPTFFESNDCLTSEVVELFNSCLSMSDSSQIFKETVETVYHNFLTQLKILRPPQFPSHPTSQAFASALYTLLPTELFSDDCGSIIDFFKRNANRDNLHFWCCWLRDRTEYKPGFPAAHHEPYPESKKLKYITELVDTFWDQGTTQKVSTNSNAYDFFNDPFEKELCHECWWVLCESRSISNAVLQKCINKSIFDFDCLHPALLTADELFFECLCDKLREKNSNSISDEFVVSASSVFVIFVAKFADNYKYFSLLVSIANKLLEWATKLWNEESNALMTIIDAFNFIVCWSFDHSNEACQNNSPNNSAVDYKNFGNQGSFQDMLHSKVIPNLKKLPKELRRKIILNKPRQAFKTIKNPLFSDFVSQDSEGGNQFHSTFNEAGGNYHGEFNFFDDDVDQLFWG